VKDGGEPEEEAEDDADQDVDVAVVAVNKDRQRRQEDAENNLDDLLNFDRHFATESSSSTGEVSEELFDRSQRRRWEEEHSR